MLHRLDYKYFLTKFMCGQAAHVAATSLALIGFFNIFGSLFSGYLGTKYKMKYILTGLYASRTLMIIVFLLAPNIAYTIDKTAVAILAQ